MLSTNVSKYLWGKLFLFSIYLINRLPTRVLNFDTPHQALLNAFLIAKFLSSILLIKIFGCLTFVHIYSQDMSKHDPRSLKCVFIVYASNKKRVQVLLSYNKKIFLRLWISHSLKILHTSSKLKFKERIMNNLSLGIVIPYLTLNIT